MHDRSDTGLRQAAERQGRIQVRVDRRLNVERRAPEFEILVPSPEANMMKSAPMVMRIHQRRDCKQPSSIATVFDAAYAAPFHLNDCVLGLHVRARGRIEMFNCY